MTVVAGLKSHRKIKKTSCFDKRRLKLNFNSVCCFSLENTKKSAKFSLKTFIRKNKRYVPHL